MPIEKAQIDTDDALMRRVALGEREALDTIFLRHRERVFSLAYRHLGDRAEAEDVTQDTFLRVLSAAARYREEGTFRTWLLTITSRLCLKKRARHASWKERLVGLIHPAMEAVAEAEVGPAESLLRVEEVGRVREAVLGLPADQRMAVLLSRFEGLSYEEIADVMGKSTQSVTSLLWRAKGRLRAALAPVSDQESDPAPGKGARFRRAGGSK